MASIGTVLKAGAWITGLCSMVSLSALTTVVLTATYFFVKRRRNNHNPSCRAGQHYPPGPAGLPFLGYFGLNSLFENQEKLINLRNEYGKIMSFSTCGQRFIFINDLDLVRYALLAQGDSINGRPRIGFADRITNGFGIARSEGTLWRTHKRFALRVFHDLGVGQGHHDLEGRVIQTMADQLIEEIRTMACSTTPSSTNNPLTVDPSGPIIRAVNNVISKLLFDIRTSEHEKFAHILKVIDESIQLIPKTTNIFCQLFSGLLLRLPGDAYSLKHMVRNEEQVVAFFQSLIEKRRSALFSSPSSSSISSLESGGTSGETHKKSSLKCKRADSGFGDERVALFEARARLGQRVSVPRDQDFTALEKPEQEIEEELESRETACYVDAFLLEAMREERLSRARSLGQGNDSKRPQLFLDYQLIRTSIEFFAAGTDTTVASLRWALFLMAKYPEVQTRVQAELDEVLDGRQPTYHSADRHDLPLTEAVLCEVHRVASLVPIGLLRVTKATRLAGFDMPEGAFFFSNFLAINRDPRVWSTPARFNLNNFYEEREGHGVVINRERSIPFSIGKRSCLGETLARQELFVFFVRVMLAFRVCAPEGGLPDESDAVVPASFFRYPRPFALRFLPRTVTIPTSAKF